jgi:hypothetical protein
VIEEIASDPDALDGLRQLIATMNDAMPSAPAPTAEGWLDTKDAAAYLGLTPNALHKHTSARTILFIQNAPGGKCWFKRSDLDAWRDRG